MRDARFCRFGTIEVPPGKRRLTVRGAVTMMQRVGAHAALNIHRHCLVPGGVYPRGADSLPVDVEAAAPIDNGVRALLHKVTIRLMKMLAGRGLLVLDKGQTYLAEPDADGAWRAPDHPNPAYGDRLLLAGSATTLQHQEAAFHIEWTLGRLPAKDCGQSSRRRIL